MKRSNVIADRLFRYVHQNNLVYNTCWEDPRIDREVLQINDQSDILVLTSAGCNALDYLLAGARSVTCVDMNPIQNALLELKAVAAQHLSYQHFFEMFGVGTSRSASMLYRAKLRRNLSEFARSYWDKRIEFFNGKRSFYYRGTAGFFARLMRRYIDSRRGLREAIEKLLASETPSDRREIYTKQIEPKLWGRSLRWILGRNITLSLLGVPLAQKQHLEKHFGGSIVRFVEQVIRDVFVDLPSSDNYFWRVYLDGRYSPTNCPEYLKEENFARLRDLVATRLSIHSASVSEYLRGADRSFDRFVLLDHLDWMPESAIGEEWGLILRRARPGTRFLWRSGASDPDFFHHVRLAALPGHPTIGDFLHSRSRNFFDLHQRDRVHTYGSVGVAELSAAA